MEPTSTLGELILEQAADAVIYANAQGVIERWNAAATALFGYSGVEVCGQNLDLIFPNICAGPTGTASTPSWPAA